MAPTARLARAGQRARTALQGLQVLQVLQEQPAPAVSRGLVAWPALLALRAKPGSAGLEAMPVRVATKARQGRLLRTAGAAPRCSSRSRTANGARRST